jgi:hypothetical protein
MVYNIAVFAKAQQLNKVFTMMLFLETMVSVLKVTGDTKMATDEVITPSYIMERKLKRRD